MKTAFRVRQMAIRALPTGALVALCLGAAATASAIPITIVNAGFESPITGTTQGGAPTGWVAGGVGGVGVWNINAFPAGYWTVPAPEGNQIAYLSDAPLPGSPASISQSLGVGLVGNTTYTLTGFEGQPLGYTAGTIYTVQLFAGVNLLSSISGTGPDHMFSAFNLTYNSDSSAFIGQTLSIVLSSNKAQVGFDKIALEANPTAAAAVPEPATLTLLGLGLCGIAARLRSRKKKSA